MSAQAISGAVTTLAADASSGDSTITVANTAGFVVGQVIAIDASGSQETDTIASIPDATHLTLTSGLANGHLSTAPVAAQGNVVGITAISNDGSLVWFVAKGKLASNTGADGTAPPPTRSTSTCTTPRATRPRSSRPSAAGSPATTATSRS